MMAAPWISIEGLTEQGFLALPEATQKAALDASLIIGPQRLLDDVQSLDGFLGEVMVWPSPFLDIIPLLERYRGKPVIIFATGDPLWFGAGSTLVRYFNAGDMVITPAPSGFQWAASRMGWPLHSVSCMTVHGRPHETVLKYLGPGHRLFVLAHDKSSPSVIASLLTGAGYGDAVMTALGHIGGGGETSDTHSARVWMDNAPDVPDFHVIAIACPDAVSQYQPLVPGLSDDAFTSDGKLTKAEVRAATLSKLKPCHGGVLWDLGCGSGAIGIEWMRAAPHARAIGFDHRQDRLDVAMGNARSLGVPEWTPVCVDYADDPTSSLADYPDPDAVFIGGGLTSALVQTVLDRLKPGGRFAVNTVTLESEMLLSKLWSQHGGHLTRINVARAESVGPFHGWRPLMPVTQWALEKSV